MNKIEQETLTKETEESIYFLITNPHSLDNFSAHAIQIWNTNFPTVEHAYQWKKFSEIRPDIAQEIVKARSPQAVKKISSQYKNEIPDNWEILKVAVMEELLYAKFKQHEDIQDFLKTTSNKQIKENSPTDHFWGVGPRGDGQNMIGKIWMSIRDNNNA